MMAARARVARSSSSNLAVEIRAAAAHNGEQYARLAAIVGAVAAYVVVVASGASIIAVAF